MSENHDIFEGRLGLRVAEFAAALGISLPKLYRDSRDGKITITRLGGVSIIEPHEGRRYIEQGRNRPPRTMAANSLASLSKTAEARRARVAGRGARAKNGTATEVQ